MIWGQSGITPKRLKFPSDLALKFITSGLMMLIFEMTIFNDIYLGQVTLVTITSQQIMGHSIVKQVILTSFCSCSQIIALLSCGTCTKGNKCAKVKTRERFPWKKNSGICSFSPSLSTTRYGITYNVTALLIRILICDQLLSVPISWWYVVDGLEC